MRAWIYLLRKGAYRDLLHIILNQAQYATSLQQKYPHRRKEERVMIATNMCSNFGGFWCSPPLQRIQGKLKSELIVAQTKLTKDSRQPKLIANSGPNHI